ncbi:S-phase kinase-associated protein 2 [Galendromus occidentalis]|uniref:S-phase kinase-associated protein 2 n=1 Tax=Galendromus occidentalis TaxID=34638 RepID=A0AAJ7WGQ8_9ACAR|nr:S-phase kinase-associated protein 2 [Galendromus occidentalis]
MVHCPPMLTSENNLRYAISDLFSEPAEKRPALAPTRQLLSRKRKFNLTFSSPHDEPRATSKHNNFKILPDEVLLKIFGYLSRKDLRACMLVSRRFKRVACDSELWHSVGYNRGKFAEKALLLEVMRGTKMLCSACASSRFHLTKPVQLPRLQLQFVDLTNAVVSHYLLTGLLQACDQLKGLSLENQALSDEVCEAIGRNKNLVTLNLCMVSGLTLEGVNHILKGCRRLNSFNVAWSTMEKESLAQLVGALPVTLKELNIAGYTDYLQDNHVAKLCDSSPDLELLCISDNRTLSPKTVITISEKLHNLRHLDLSRCHQLFWPEFVFPLKKLTKFEHLSCYGFPEERYVEEIRAIFPKFKVNEAHFRNLSSIARPQPSYGADIKSLWGVPMRC